MKREPKEKWSVQRVYQRISLVKRDMSGLNRDMNEIDGMVNHLRHQKMIIRGKISKKGKYLRQLGEQLNEVKCKGLSSVQTGI